MHRLRALHLTTGASLRSLTLSLRALQWLSPTRMLLCRPPITAIDGSGKNVEIKHIDSFENLPNVIPEWLKANIAKMGFTKTTPIQSATMPFLIEGLDVIGLAPTGSGKTAAFAVPALARFTRNRNGNPAILVISPVRELVQQTTKVFREVGGHNVITCEAYGGTPRGVQARDIRRGCDVLVACPGRLTDFLQSGTASLDDVRFLVMDEADRLLDMGFQPQIDEIMQYCNQQNVQVMMWSATWPTSVQHLAQTYLKPEAIMVRAGDGTGQQINKDIVQRAFLCQSLNDKGMILRDLVQKGDLVMGDAKIIVFVKTQADCDSVAAFMSRCLEADPRRFGVIHGGLEQDRRDAVISAFKSGKRPILVATDVASRGLDIPDVHAVINFTTPNDIDSYCHRIGRTGRAGRKGKAFTFAEPRSGLLGPLVEYLDKCKQDVSEDLRRAAQSSARFSESKSRFGRRGGGYGGRGRGRGRGGGGGGYGRMGGDDFGGAPSQRKYDSSWDEGGASTSRDTFDDFESY